MTANIEAFKQEIELARAAVADKQLDEVVPSRGHHPERGRDIRWIYLHMIEEYVRTMATPTSSGSGSTALPVFDAHVPMRPTCGRCGLLGRSAEDRWLRPGLVCGWRHQYCSFLPPS